MADGASTSPGVMRDGRFVRERTVEERHIDALGHVNNLVWIRFVVELATAHSDFVGWDESAYRAFGAWWVIYRQEVDYRAPAFVGERLREETGIVELRGARCVRRTRIERSGQTLLEARTTWVWTEARTGRPRRVPEEMKQAFPVIDDWTGS